MHIGMDISRIAAAARTGTEHYTYELLAALARVDAANRYTLYCNRPPAALPPLGPNMALRPIPLPRLWTHARLSAELLAHPPDVLFVPAHVLPLATPRARRTRAVVTVHDLGYLRFPEAHTRGQRLALRLSTVWSARVAQRVIAVSHATRDDLVRRARVPADKISVVHHGVRMSAKRKAQSDRDLSIAVTAAPDTPNSRPPYFLYVGTIQPRKNLIRLIEAFAAFSLQPSALGVHLVIAGKRGWLAEGIERRAAELGVAGRVRFLGYVPDEELPALMAGALGFVFPSLYEGFGMPPLEAMACGTPVVVSSSSSLPEVVGDAGLVVSPDDPEDLAEALHRVLTDAELRERLHARGLQQARRFSWRDTAERTLAVYQEAAVC